MNPQDERIREMGFGRVYDAYVAKVERKGLVNSRVL
jgi:hypothetical protein